MSGGSGRLIAGHLIRIGAVSVSPDDPFTWASGLHAPIYCDNRATLAHPEVRTAISHGFAAKIESISPKVDAVIGVATGAIAHASFVAERMQLPLGYVRAASKEHGRRNRIEGFNIEGARVVVIEDLVSTGGSSLAAVESVEEAGMEVAAVLAIFTYAFPFSHEAFDVAGIPLSTLVRFEDLLAEAAATGTIDNSGKAVLEAWSRDPKAWSEEHRSN